MSIAFWTDTSYLCDAPLTIAHMLKNLSDTNSIANRFVAEMRNVNVQQDRLRFRRNMERLG